MSRDALVLIGRETASSREVYDGHAERLRRRDVAEEVRLVRYRDDSVDGLAERLDGIDADRTFVVPLSFAHTRETTDCVPAALSELPGSVHYCEPVGRSPVVTSIVADVALDHGETASETSLVLVGFGSGSGPHERRAAEYHASRMRGTDAFADVHCCYLIEDPAVECARYSVTGDRIVAVPLFFAPTATTRETIPRKLGLDWDDHAYARPLGVHDRVTDAIAAEVAKQRVLAAATADGSSEASLATEAGSLVADGSG